MTFVLTLRSETSRERKFHGMELSLPEANVVKSESSIIPNYIGVSTERGGWGRGMHPPEITVGDANVIRPQILST